MKKMFSFFLLVVLTNFFVNQTSYSQEAEMDEGYNPLSLRQVHKDYVMWNRTIWQRIEMKEKINRPFFSVNKELSKIIIDAVEANDLIAYWPDQGEYYDSATNIMIPTDFLVNLEQESIDEEKCESDAAGCNDSGCPGDVFFEPCAEEEVDYIPDNAFSAFRIRENVYFDRIHSRLYFDIQTITMLLPANSMYNTGLLTQGADKQIATFRFIDLYNLFKDKNLPYYKYSIWFNEHNTAQHKNMGDAFLLRLFSGNIVKFSNFENKKLTSFYSNDGMASGLHKSREYLLMLMEWESNLWEY
jgi:gliding motility associated protien GldN